jgi:hypothetical protein
MGVAIRSRINQQKDIMTKPTSPEAVAKAQNNAYKSFKEVADAAFKIDGMRGVIDAALSAQDQMKASLAGQYSDAKLVKALKFLSDMWTPLTLSSLATVEKAGGLEAFKAAQAKGKK